MKSHLKNRIKQFLPPLLFNYVNNFRNYHDFLKHSNLIKTNINLKNKHKGEKCFILGSGPSINDEDLKPLKNEIVFALNNFYVHDDFSEIMRGEVEKYYMTAPIHPPQTETEWKDWFSDMEQHMPKNVNLIFGISNQNNNIKSILSHHNLFVNFKKYWYYAGININDYYNYKPRDIDITRMTWIADTISIYSIIVAIYMGFSEIYLLGMDHNYICNNKSNYRFYKDGIHQNDEDERMLKDTSLTKHLSFSIYKIFHQYELLSNNSDTEIYNTSRNSLLDIFEYVTFKDIIK
tara:strand:- start:3034 stop:3906 length:873 start_codon:yes stop_codon:yes gene_type:complete